MAPVDRVALKDKADAHPEDKADALKEAKVVPVGKVVGHPADKAARNRDRDP